MEKNQKAFTLIELLVVIAVIGLLASVVLVAMNNSRAKARDAKRIAEKKQAVTAFNLYYNDNGKWPLTVSSFTPSSNCLASSSETCWLGSRTGLDSLVSALSPYLSSLPTNNVPSGVRAYNRLLYTDNANAGDIVAGSPAGAWLIWVQETGMTPDKCASNIISNYSDGYLYCYEFLGPP